MIIISATEIIVDIPTKIITKKTSMRGLTDPVGIEIGSRKEPRITTEDRSLG